MSYGEIDCTFIRALDKSRSICNSKKGSAALKDNVKSNLIYNVEFFFFQAQVVKSASTHRS